MIRKGTMAYQTYCVGCHGENGDGQGEAAKFLHPKPRNFQTANYKFSSTRAGQLPTDTDLNRAIFSGLNGTAMPSYPLLPQKTIDALIQTIKTFSPKWNEKKSDEMIPFADYTFLADKTAAIARGEAIYHGYAKCWSCHPAYVSKEIINEYLVMMENSTQDVFRDRLFDSVGSLNSDNELIYATDFRRDVVRAGPEIYMLYQSIAAGITGSAMPTWVDSFDIASEKHPDQKLIQPSDLWAITYYVQDLIKHKPTKLAEDEVDVRDRSQTIYLHGKPEVELMPDTNHLGQEFDEED